MQLPPSQISHLEEGKTVKLLLSMFGVLSREPNLSTWTAPALRVDAGEFSVQG